MTATQLIAALRRVTALNFNAVSRHPPGWSRQGEGRVDTEYPDAGTVVFHESGRWQSAGQAPVPFRNVYRWSIQKNGATRRLSLEHLRLGPQSPVHLLDLAPHTGQDWRCIEAHACGEDRYELRLQILGASRGIHLAWKIHGPMKDDRIDCVYSF